MFDNILVGLDGSDASERALVKAFAISQLTGGGVVRALCVEEQSPTYVETAVEIEEAKKLRDKYFHRVEHRARALAEQVGIELQTEIVSGRASHALLEKATKYDSDLIIVGRSGHSRGDKLFLGATADRIVEQAPCSVLVIP